ncbi:MAG: response regulator [Planctomycetota bacterium]|jgi:DNA-binding response OmpR family regulator
MSEPPTAPARLLIVEDDPVYARILRAHLGRLGDRVGSVEHATRMDDGLRLHGERAADLVLLDLTLPDSAPEDTLATVRRFVDGGARVLVLSALDDPGTAAAARAAGAVDFVDKAAVSADRIASALGEEASRDGSSRDGADEAQPAPPRPATEPGSPRQLAAQLVHDAKSWLTNHSFRLAALRRTVGPEAAGLLDGLEDSARAVTALLDGGRALVTDETTPCECAAVDLGARLVERAGRVAEEGGGPISARTPEGSVEVLACEAGLDVVLGALLDNTREAAGDDAAEVELSVVEASGDSVTVDVLDGGGDWSVRDPERLVEPFQKGERGSTRAGLGLHRAARWMERMGGALELVRRDDAPGAVAVRLRFRRG